MGNDWDRRDFFRLGMAGLAGAAMLDPQVLEAAAKRGGPINQRADGTYDTVPLAKDVISLGVVQSRVMAVDAGNAVKKRRENVQHMCDLIDYANGFSGKKDLLFFHEFPITGYNYKLNLADSRRIAIEVPGEETEILAKKAREHGTWLVFGSYVRDPDWPDSLLSITTIMNDKGEVVDKHWKARNIKGAFGGFELFTTTVYDVLDRYVEMYGADAVIPVTRTPIGNISTSSIQREPEVFRAMAMKGAEIILRTASGGFTPADIAATSMYNQVYTAISNNAASPDNGLYFEDAGGGGQTGMRSRLPLPPLKPVSKPASRSAISAPGTASRSSIASWFCRSMKPIVRAMARTCSAAISPRISWMPGVT